MHLTLQVRIPGALAVIQGTLVVIQGTLVVIQGILVVIQGTFVVIQGTLAMIQRLNGRRVRRRVHLTLKVRIPRRSDTESILLILVCKDPTR
jgi:hypothetical protein